MILKKSVSLLTSLLIFIFLSANFSVVSGEEYGGLTAEETAYMNKQAAEYLNSEAHRLSVSEDENEYVDIVTGEKYKPGSIRNTDTPPGPPTDPNAAKDRARLIQAYLSEPTIPWTPGQFEWLASPDKEKGKADIKKDMWSFTQAQDTRSARYAVINSGMIIPAMLLSGLNSDLPGHLIAQVSENIYDSPSGKKILIPQGSRLFGEYDSKVIFGQKRPLVKWLRLIYPDGSVLDLENMAGTDKAGYAGFKANVDNHYAPMFGSVAMISVFAGLANEYGKDKTTIQLYEPKVTLGESLPIGALINYGGKEVPENFLLANGSGFDEAIYTDLANVLGGNTLPSPVSIDGTVWIIKARNTYSLAANAYSGTTVIDEKGSPVVGELAHALANMADKLLQQYVELAPTLKVSPGYRFSVLVNKEIVLPVL